jgi:hypothetical protein
MNSRGADSVYDLGKKWGVGAVLNASRVEGGAGALVRRCLATAPG